MTQASYREILKSAFESRCVRNPRYSLRAFARDIGVSAPRLSNVLNGRFGFSKASALTIGCKIGLQGSDLEFFCDLVESEHARSALQRLAAQQRLESFLRKYEIISEDQFAFISDWVHLAVLELAKTTDGSLSISNAVQRLGATDQEVRSALERLVRLGKLVADDAGGEIYRLQLKADLFANPAGVPSQAVRSFHSQLIEKARAAVDSQSSEKRSLGALVVSIDEADFPHYLKLLDRFHEEFDLLASRSKSPQKVYALSTQFFSLEQS